jgi:non-specific serine/threonine protein kinase
VEKFIYQCADLCVDPANRRLTRGGIEIALEPKAFAVLRILVARAGELITRDELLDAVWGHRHLTPATLNRVMTLLRRMLHDDADHLRIISTVHGAGYRFIGAVERLAVVREEIRAHFGPPPIAQLPAKLEALIGRERELECLRAMLSKHRAVTVIGAGGMGKTQCALEVGRQCAADFPDGVWFFDLSPLDRAEDWVRALAATLSVPIAGTQSLAQRTAAALAGRKALLLIDNCDRLATEIGIRVFELLRSCPDLIVLATSQQRLDFVGEHLMWLPPLDLPPSANEAEHMPLDEIAATPSVALLLSRAHAAYPGISLRRDNVADIVEICRRLDGMPLALELAAAQFATLSPRDIRERLSRHFGLLASDSAGREPRHETMQSLVEWSYGLLSSREQQLLCWLGVFLQGWTIDAVETFAGALEIDGAELVQLHSGLVLKSLVVVDPTLSPTRYRLLETVREFALQLLRARGEEGAARRAHLRRRNRCGVIASRLLDMRGEGQKLDLEDGGRPLPARMFAPDARSPVQRCLQMRTRLLELAAGVVNPGHLGVAKRRRISRSDRLGERAAARRALVGALVTTANLISQTRRGAGAGFRWFRAFAAT